LIRNRRLLPALALVTGFVVIVALGLVFFGDGEDGLRPSSLSVEEVYGRVEQRLRESDRVLVVESSSEFSAPFEYTVDTRYWIDGREQVVRERFESDRFGSIEAVTNPEERFSREQDGRSRVVSSRAHQCYGAGVAASALLGCPGPTDNAEARVEEGRHGGRKVIVLVHTGTSRGSDQSMTYERRLYLDGKTLLPIEESSEGIYDDGSQRPYTASRTFRSMDWQDRDVLPAGFFEPAAIGFVPPDPEAGIRGATDLQVYWLGREFSAPGVDALVLRSSFAAPGRGAPYRYSLTYARKANPHEPPFLTLQVFFRDMWDRSPAIAAQAAFLDDTVVFFSESNVPGSSDRVLTPAALEELKRGLRPYEP
jgi:hypothetical protein